MLLNPVEIRVLATLAEKQRTVPDTYPLSLNALVAGCNQKTSRNPVMELSDADALQALDSLKAQGLVAEVGGGRVARFAHALEKTLGIPSQASALLVVLMLRGPQTAGELRLNAERLHAFADISSVEAFLEELAAHPGSPLVAELPRAPGSRENRWTHLLGEPPAAGASPGREGPEAGGLGHEVTELKARVAALEAELAEMKSVLARLATPA